MSYYMTGKYGAGVEIMYRIFSYTNQCKARESNTKNRRMEPASFSGVDRSGIVGSYAKKQATTGEK